MKIQAKKKICSGCEEEKIIWKNYEGEKYCQYCWNIIKYKQDPPKPKKQEPIASKSKKREKLDILYSKLRKIFLTKHPVCQAALPGCMRQSTDVHHTHAGSNRNKYYLVVSTWLATCRHCHSYIHEHPREARELRYLE